MKKIKHSLKWFTNRINKTVYREDVSCRCHSCKELTQHGLKIHNKQHAEYLEMVARELDLNYQDKPFNYGK